MKFDKLNVIIILLCAIIIGLLFQNRKINDRLDELEGRVDDAVSYAEEASRHAEEAADNAFGNRCSECPEDLRYR